MLTALAAAAVAFVVSLVLTPAARLAGTRLGVVDRPDQYRKIHLRPVPLTGGFAVALAFVAACLLLPFYDRDAIKTALRFDHRQVVALLIGVVIVAALGAIDDVFHLRPRTKLLYQFVAASLAWLAGFAITVLSNPFGEPLVLGWLSFPVTILWFLSCMNAINLVDGLDGLATGVGLFASVTMALVSHVTGNPGSMFLSACLGGALLGFLVFNFHPASIFLGDAGTMVIGFLIAALALMGSVKAGAAVALIVPVIALGLPAFDTALAIVRRWGQRVPVSTADARHTHHLLLAWGLSQRGVVLLLYLVCIVLGGAALLLSAGNNKLALLLLGTLSILAFVFIRVFATQDVQAASRRLAEDLQLKRQSRRAAELLERARQTAALATTADELWAGLAEVFAQLGLDEVQGALMTPSGSRQFSWARQTTASLVPPAGNTDELTWGLVLQDQGRDLGRLVLRRRRASAPLPDLYVLACRLRLLLTRRLEQLNPPREGPSAPGPAKTGAASPA